MFDKKAQTQALIIADEGAGNVEDTDIHGTGALPNPTVSYSPSQL